MGGEKIRLAKQAIEEAHRPPPRRRPVRGRRLRRRHRRRRPGHARRPPDARRTALDRLRDDRRPRHARTSARAGCAAASRSPLALADEGVNRCLLLTDGLANVGITDRDELARHAAELRARGVSTTTFGVGDDFDEVLLQSMADAGGGHFYFIATAAAIRDHITSEVGETLEVVARDVDARGRRRRGRPGRVAQPLPGPRAARGRTEVTLGDLRRPSGLEVVLRLNFPYGEVGRSTPARSFGLSDRDGVVRRRDGRSSAWDVRRQRGQRPPAARPRRRPGRRPDLRRPRPPGGRRAEPARRLRRRPPRRRGDRPPDPRLRRARPGAARDRRRARP